MSSILERPNLNKIFLIYGNLDDMFMTPDLQKNNFRPFLNSYLRSIGYEQIVFYSGAKNVGKYVLDDYSAKLAINRNNSAILQGGSFNHDSVRMRRILNPRIEKEQKIDAETTSNKSIKNSIEIIYKQPKITPVEFLDEAKKMMSNSNVKTAIVFSFLQDFVTDGAAPLQQYYELLSHLWDEYTLNSNENICIFLAPQMNSESILHLFNSLSCGEVFKNRFYNDNNQINSSCTMHIGLPNQDEIKYMLEYLRLVGENGRKITYLQKDTSKLVSSLMYASRKANMLENRAGYLSTIYDNIVWYMKNRKETVIAFTEATIQEIYANMKLVNSSNPLEILKNTEGWETVASRVSEIVEDYERRKKEFLRSTKNVVAKSLYGNDRIDTSNNKCEMDYPVPHFILKGNPGVGKTTIARLIGQIFYEAGMLENGITVEATRDDLIDKYIGGTTEKTRNCVIKAQGGVLFVDDAYSLIEEGNENNYPKQAIDELVAIMTNRNKYHFCLILAGYPEPMEQLLQMNPGLYSRFSKSNILTIEDYSPSLLKSIFMSNCTKNGYYFSGEEADRIDLNIFFENLYQQRNRTNFGNARDVVTIAQEVMMKCALRNSEDRCIQREDFGDYEYYFKSHGASSIEDIYYQLSQYVGLDFIKELFENVRLEILDEFDSKKRGIVPDSYPEHYIFAGNPGTGKTTVGKMMGKFYHLMGVLGGNKTLFVDASELIGEHVGESKNKVIAKFQEAIDNNAVLYIDEAYQIIDSMYASEIIGAMMTKMTENASDFKVIFGMYLSRVEDFLRLNVGLSRRLRVVRFPDYTPEQLVQIFDKTIEAQGRTITEEAHNLIKILMEHKYNTRTEYFGNAGDVKVLVNDMKKILLKRTNNTDKADRYKYISDDIPKEQLDLIKDQINPKKSMEIIESLNSRIGLTNLKKIIMQKREEILYAKKIGESTYDINPGYYFFVGNPGTGKSTSAKLFAECLSELGIVKTNKFYSCTAKDLIGRYVGETDKKTYNLLNKAKNGVLFIDEAYGLSYTNMENTNSSFKKEALEQIVAFMDEPDNRKKCCIIFAGYPKDMISLYESNSGLRSRIEEVYFEDYTPEEMYNILEYFCNENGYLIDYNVKNYYTSMFEKMSKKKYFSNGRTARTVYEKTVANFKHRVINSNEKDKKIEHVLLMVDALTEQECYKIVDS